MPNIAILDQIDSTNFSSIKQIYQPLPGYSGFITALALTINLKSIPGAEFPYIPDDTPPDVLEQTFRDMEEQLVFKELRILLKKGAGAWIQKATIRIFNKEPFYEVDLMPYFTKANTIDVAEDLSLGIQLALGDTLAADIDKILIFGNAIEEKKNNGNEELASRIAMLESILEGMLSNLPANSLLGRGATTGATSIIPASTFATPAQITTAINALGTITFRAGKTATQSLTRDIWNKITFETETNDFNNQYNPSTSRLTAVQSEIWNINPSVTVTLTVASRLLLSVWKNGTEIAGSRYLDIAASSGDFQLSSNVELALIAGDYLEVYVLIIATTGSPSVRGEPQMLATSWGGKRVR